ncbi:MAG: phosphotransferase [Coriobacteriales bacterium]|jgi:CTP:phosphocholine cytidylyltransferase-like protein/thiamine kinase-like enzyme|nr:phosphotransferase [Coriobacteriales bacterium]
MLSENQFLILRELRQTPDSTQRELSRQTGLSLGTVNTTINNLSSRGFLETSGVTARGIEALDPYRVDNAIIMAAGISSRFVPISYEKPKGTLTVRGEILIERLIRQLQEVGIDDITVVIGYMKEQYLYLEDAFDVKLVINEEFAERNNNSTLKLVERQLANTYIITSDSYFAENVFASHVYRAYYASVFMEGPTDEYCIKTEGKKRIVKITTNGTDEWAMFGEAYFNRKFSQEFVRVLNEVYDRPETKPKLWELIYAEHVERFDMDIKKYPGGIIYEFDSLEDVRQFDPDFITNIDSAVLDNICATLECQRAHIRGIKPIEEGLSNFSFYFRVGDMEAQADENDENESAGVGEYVSRHPGIATQGILNRAIEAEVEDIARDLGLDKTFLYQDPNKGWKISRFIHISEPFDYHNNHHVKTALSMVRTLHRSGEIVNNNFDIHEETNKIKALLAGSTQLDFPDFEELDTRATRLYEHVRKDSDTRCLCHNDFYEPNILISNDTFYLIDWEYTGMSDYASDLGTFICCSDYSYEEAISVLETYHGRTLTPRELLHCMAYVSLSGYYWFIWALNKEAANEPVGEWLHLWYRFAKEYGVIAEKLLEEHGAHDAHSTRQSMKQQNR